MVVLAPIERFLARPSPSPLFKAGAPKTVEIAVAVSIPLEWYLLRNPGKRDIGLGTTKLLHRSLCDPLHSGHPGRCSQHPMRADKIIALPERFATQANRFLIIAANELGVGDDAAIDRREWI